MECEVCFSTCTFYVCKVCQKTEFGKELFQAYKMKRRTQRMMIKYGVSNTSKLPSVKKRIQKGWELSCGGHPMRNKRIKSNRAATEAARYVGGHHSRDPSVRQQRLDTIYKRNDGNYYPVMNEEMLRKREVTFKKRYGGHPMTDPAVRSRVMSTAYSNKHTVIQGREFTFQGYEDRAIEMFLTRFELDDIRTQFDHVFPILKFQMNGRQTSHMPDLYVQKKYIEVKSWWTLFGREEWLVRNRLIQQQYNHKKRSLRFMVVDKDRGCFLPSDWHTWDIDKLKTLLTERGVYRNRS